ncbi:MAG: sigma-70 family RNA polymerase sigma factor [Pirellula sp.]|jgi:RNA polymerase sigma factor (sigma-70 family)|nr:sigma-70 family RNA polymerase sigma factor [Pirellula sp.]
MENQADTLGKALLDYLPRLIRLAEKNMSRPLQARLGADDLANSVVGSVFRAFCEGKLKVNFEDDEQFWRFLVVVALNKIRKRARDHSTDKRNVTLDQSLSDLEYLIQESSDPSDEEGAQVAQILQKLEEELDQDGKIILKGKFEGQSNLQIAEQLKNGMGASTKTVSRRWKEIQQRLREIIEELDLG